jgi:hypothetical protein
MNYDFIKIRLKTIKWKENEKRLKELTSDLNEKPKEIKEK